MTVKASWHRNYVTVTICVAYGTRTVGLCTRTFTKHVRVQPRPSAVNVTLPAFANERRAAALLLLSASAAGTRRRQLSIDISCPRGAQQQTCRPPLLLSTDVTDRRTDARPFHRPCSACYAGSVSNRRKTELCMPLSFRQIMCIVCPTLEEVGEFDAQSIALPRCTKHYKLDAG